MLIRQRERFKSFISASSTKSNSLADEIAKGRAMEKILLK
jgi:hypothetical protein